jgi:2-phospho-L-lactate guanylyltransferase
MIGARRLHVVVPVKDTSAAKGRLAEVLEPAARSALALAMLEDVLAALAQVPEIDEIVVVTIDSAATVLAESYGARVSALGATNGHTGAVNAAARALDPAADAMLTLPGDVPLVRADDVAAILAAHEGDRGFTIVPSHDELGSNAILCSPPGVVALRFGDDSFFPHLAAARAAGVEPAVVYAPRIALDVDCPTDLAALLAVPARTRAHAMLERHAPGRTFAEFRAAAP